jgi:transposase-like protein
MAIELPDGRCESNDVLDALRLRAVHARELGYAVVDIAAILGVREETVSRWCSRYERGGEEALPGDRTGRPIGSGRVGVHRCSCVCCSVPGARTTTATNER